MKPLQNTRHQGDLLDFHMAECITNCRKSVLCPPISGKSISITCLKAAYSEADSLNWRDQRRSYKSERIFTLTPTLLWLHEMKGALLKEFLQRSIFRLRDWDMGAGRSGSTHISYCNHVPIMITHIFTLLYSIHRVLTETISWALLQRDLWPLSLHLFPTSERYYSQRKRFTNPRTQFFILVFAMTKQGQQVLPC